MFWKLFLPSVDSLNLPAVPCERKKDLSGKYYVCHRCDREMAKAKLRLSQYESQPGFICLSCRYELSVIHSSCAASSAPKSQPMSPVAPPSTRTRSHSAPGQKKIKQTQTHKRKYDSIIEYSDWDPPYSEFKPDAQLEERIAAEKTEYESRTPAQWARRHYLMHVAPRCINCNFPRTGPKGWNKKKQCHSSYPCHGRVMDTYC